MANCPAITAEGNPCRGVPVHGGPWCYSHHPDHVAERKRYGSRGGKRGGGGRPTSELKRLGARFEELAQQVLDGEVERGVGAVVGQLLNGARACVRDSLTAREQEELISRLEALEAALEARNERSGRTWPA